MSKVLKGQNLHDIAIQETGSAGNAFDIALRNDIAVTDLLNTEAGITLPDTINKDAKVVGYFSSQQLKPASENRGIVGSAIGINFWTIEEDFIIT